MPVLKKWDAKGDLPCKLCRQKMRLRSKLKSASRGHLEAQRRDCSCLPWLFCRLFYTDLRLGLPTTTCRVLEVKRGLDTCTNIRRNTRLVPDYWSWRNSDIKWEQNCILWAAVTPKAGSTSIPPAVLSLTKMTENIGSLQIKSSTIHSYPAHLSNQIMAGASHFHTQHLFSQREHRALTEVANTLWLLEGVILVSFLGIKEHLLTCKL